MNKLTKTLLAGVALCTLTAVPAIAENATAFHVTALHSGRVVNKTKLPKHGAHHLTYTFGVYSYISASSDFKKKVRTGRFGACGWTSMKIKVDPKKTQYAKIGTYRETYSNGCGSGTPLVIVGATYKLTNPAGEGNTDYFVASASGKFEQNGTKYKGTLNLDVSVFIEK